MSLPMLGRSIGALQFAPLSPELVIRTRFAWVNVTHKPPFPSLAIVEKPVPAAVPGTRQLQTGAYVFDVVLYVNL